VEFWATDLMFTMKGSLHDGPLFAAERPNIQDNGVTQTSSPLWLVCYEDDMSDWPMICPKFWADVLIVLSVVCEDDWLACPPRYPM
jgi:hypothetical protein